MLPFLVACLLVPAGLPGEANAQEFPRNNVFVDISRDARFFSLNVERRLSAFSVARGGVMVYHRPISGPARDRVDVSIPAMVSILDGFRRLGRHRLEMGAGPVLGLVHERRADETVSGRVRGGLIATVGYRYQPLDEGILVRIGNTICFYAGGQVGGSLLHLSLGYTY